MIDLYYWPTPNGHKITLFVEEAAVPYRIVPVNIGQGEQFTPEYLRISPNNKMPAIVDHAPADGGGPLSIFESGAILEYLAMKTGRFLPSEPRARAEVMQWLFWQVGGLGPMLGQNNHFARYAPEKIPYAIERYVKETTRLFRVLDQRLADREYVAGEYSIADMACHPWLTSYGHLGQNIDDTPHLKRWLAAVGARPAVQRAYALEATVGPRSTVLTEEEKKILFGQTGPRPGRS